MIEIGDIYSHTEVLFVIQVFKINLFEGEEIYCKVLESAPTLTSYPVGSTYILNLRFIKLYKKLTARLNHR
jgi:hypothetical protein